MSEPPGSRPTDTDPPTRLPRSGTPGNARSTRHAVGDSQITRAQTSWNLGFTGAGVGVAVIDTGVAGTTRLFQAKVRLTDRALTGFEALLRWNHQRLGPVEPDEFIALAEKTGSIQQITQFVLETALRQAAEWRRDGRRWSVAINLSTRNLLDDDLAPGLGRLLQETGVDPALVTLEITETSVRRCRSGDCGAR